MKTRSILLLSLIFTLLLAGCASGQPAAATGSQATATAVSKPEIEYQILGMEIGRTAKCVMNIRLPEKITEGEIEHLARYFLENEGRGCSPLFIFYYLPGDEVLYESAWAYSHFNPELEIKISVEDSD